MDRYSKEQITPLEVERVFIADIASKDKRNPIGGSKDAPKELTDRQKVIFMMRAFCRKYSV